MKLQQLRLGLVILVALLADACSAEMRLPSYEPAYETRASSSVPEYVFGIHPLHNPIRVFERFGPLINYLNASIPQVRFRLETSRDYTEFERKLIARKFEFALPNPYQTLLSFRCGYHTFGKMGNDDEFRGLILVRRDSGIHELRDLKGKVVSYPAPSALAATILPQYFLQTHGLDVKTDIKNSYVGSQESAIMNAYLGFSAAGATWPLPWKQFQQEHPEKAAELLVKWKTPSLPNNGLVVRDDVPQALRDRVRDLLLNLHKDPAGRKLLDAWSLPHFEAADDTTYLPIEKFVRDFESKVRLIKQ